MNRKQFFRNLLMGGAGAFLPRPDSSKETKTQKIWLATLFIAGRPYYDGPEAEDLLESGMGITLNRQPHNKYDKYAIEVFCGEAKLGYMPKADNKTIAKLMDKGIEVKAEIKEILPESYDRVKIEVWYDRKIG